MPRILKYTVVPKLPERLEGLIELARNLWWCWNPEAIALFFRISPDLWVQTNQNPVRMLGQVSQARLDELERDDSFLAHLDRALGEFREYMAGSAWREKHPDAPDDFNVAYLSAEFGVHESLSIYSGGLGVLAGDHMKSASDLGLPLTGVGLLYREGYHSQYLNADGWQQERYPRNDFYNMAVTLVRDEAGKPVTVEAPLPERRVQVRAWKLMVGRVPIYLLDCDFEANHPDDREITARLYGGDMSMRVRQEIVLGMAGVRMLHKLGIWPSVFHMNEGHAAFMTLERIRNLMQDEKLTFPHALEAVKAGSVFTTHTPVPAGNDMFPPEMVQYYFDRYVKDVGISMDQLLALGRQDPKDAREPFCMTVLALRLSAASNGVSALHGEVARSMWARTWRGVPTEEVPITHITNGIHTRFWVSRDMTGLYDRYLGPAWVANPADPNVWAGVDSIPDPELWRTHERRRERLVNFARRRLANTLRDRGASQREIDAAHEVLDPDMLTIGFARRFATYKRAYLLFMDPERLVRILTNPTQPVQMLIGGKAHPADNHAKELIRNIVHFLRERNLRNHVVFLEDYDINVARYMVQGVDCWLNTPRRPMEASGTSGMKVSANGGMNISIPDGWWCEAMPLGENGFSIGRGELYDDPNEQDQVESEMLYQLLEREIVPRFYDRGRDGLPREWIRMMKEAIKTIGPVFNTHRMVEEYTQRFYLPCASRRERFAADKRRRSQELATWKAAVQEAWPNVRVEHVSSGPTEDLPFGSELDVEATLNLGGLNTNDVCVEVYYGELDPSGQIVRGQASTMACVGSVDGRHRYAGSIGCSKTGQLGFTVRVIPSHPDLAHKHETTLIQWA